MVSVLGGTGTALIVACLLTALAVLVGVTNDAAEAATLDPSRTRNPHYGDPTFRSCFSWSMLPYLALALVCNFSATLLVPFGLLAAWPTFEADLGGWSNVIYAILGVLGFQVVMTHTNITIFDKGFLHFQDWLKKARRPAAATALSKHIQKQDELRIHLLHDLKNVPEEDMNTYLLDEGGEQLVKEIEEKARVAGADPKLYKALELVKRNPTAAAAIVKSIKRKQR